MHSPTIMILSIALGFLTCSDKNLSPSSLTPETPAQVVRGYVSLAREGKFDKLESVTALVSPDEQKREAARIISESKKARTNSNNSAPFTVIPDPSVAANATLEWVTGDFAKSIYDEKLSVKSIRNESANETEARVEIVLGNEKVIHSLGWVFLLRKVDEKWKIYNITTPGGLLETVQ